MLDEKLLLDIFHIPAPSTKEDEITKFVISWLTMANIPFSFDETSKTIFNISNFNSPLLAAHLDTVQKDLDTYLAKFIKIRNNTLYGYGVIGADDKCGIYLILELLKENDKLNFCFFPGEEVGCTGSRDFVKNNKDFSNIPYGLVLDRRNAGDIICERNNYGTKEFDAALSKIGEGFGYKSCVGAVSDANTLKEFISCANLSVGYYNPHTVKEYVNLVELENTLNYVRMIIATLDKKFEKPVYVAPVYNYKGFGSYGRGYDDLEYSGYDYNESYWDKPKGKDKFSKCDICNIYSSIDKIYVKAIKKSMCKDCFLKLYTEMFELDYLLDDSDVKDLAPVEELSYDDSIEELMKEF